MSTKNPQVQLKLPKKQSQLKEFWHIFKSNRPAMVGLVIVVILFAIAACADLIVPYEKAIDQTLSERMEPPSEEHIFGMDPLGRDVFARIIHGSRVSLTMGFIPTLVELFFGMFFGACAAYFGGWVDNLIMRLCDIFACISVGCGAAVPRVRMDKVHGAGHVPVLPDAFVRGSAGRAPDHSGKLRQPRDWPGISRSAGGHVLLRPDKAPV